MPIQNINSANLLPFPIGQEKKEALSKTDWKTYSFVVLSYFSIGVGFVLACSAVYTATLLAIASPVLPIALGILGLQYTATQQTNQFNLLPPGDIIDKPRGLDNKSGNCWINATCQILFHVPAWKGRLEHMNTQADSPMQKVQKNLSPKSWIFPVIDAYRNYIGPVVSCFRYSQIPG